MKDIYWEIIFLATIDFFIFFSFTNFEEKLISVFYAQICHKKISQKFSFSTSELGSQTWYFMPKPVVTCLLHVNSPQTISKFIFQTIFTKLWMLFFIVWKNRRQFQTKPVSIADKWTFSLTLCVRETENIIGFEYGSSFLEIV